MTANKHTPQAEQPRPSSDQYSWDLESIFPDLARWESELDAIRARISELATFQGRLLGSADTLYGYLELSQSFAERVGRLRAYAYLRYHRDTSDEAAGVLLSRADQLASELAVAESFFASEVLSIGVQKVADIVRSDDRLSKFAHLFDDLERWRAHTPSSAVEAALATISPVLSSPEAVRTALHDAEMRFEAVEVAGKRLQVSYGVIDELMTSPDRQARKAAYASYTDTYLRYPSTFAQTLSAQANVSLTFNKVRGFTSTFERKMFEEAFFFAERYLFIMPTMSTVEHALHTRMAQGNAMSAGELCEATVSAFSEAYGDSVQVDTRRLGVKWAKFCHFYSPYYFFQYAIGLSAAMAIGQRLLAGERGVREKYLTFLKAGGSNYPAEIFKIVDIDITGSDVYQGAFQVVQGYVERLEALASA